MEIVGREREWFTRYRDQFERDVIEKGIIQGVLGAHRLVPVRKGKLASTGFGAWMGVTVPSDTVFSVDYYGLLRHSLGLLRLVEEKREALRGRQLKKVEAPMVHFAAIRIEDVMSLTGNNMGLMAGFPIYKAIILKRRKFDTKKEGPCQS